MASIPLQEGQRAFGSDPANYERGRPNYPPQLYEILQQECGIGPTTHTFEIGPGTGQVTRGLLGLGVAHLTAIEPDERLSGFLAEACRDEGVGRLEILTLTFEAAPLVERAFGLGIAATAFHWLEAGPALAKVFRLLRPGGWWVACWNIFNDPFTPDPFREATSHLFRDLAKTPSFGEGDRRPFGLDVEARTQELTAAGFQRISSTVVRRTMILDTDSVLALYATFSQVTRLLEGDRLQFMRSLKRIAQDEFEGKVPRTFLTPIYWAQRP
ncbi:dimethyladenosine transferase (rRNA methylation) [Microvirga lotononidis]|uniref:Dimethyladenosine transferase (RRNA methylation) n=2 Tax=Microvirga lotononidis TaxID=864069 RepID=I4YXA1_9HYPH|nr:dimethyladenosine transferase (rRNA methylation) [Microvirga lotononidis]